METNGKSSGEQQLTGESAVVMAGNLREGMVLAEDLYHFNGRLIHKKGTILQQKDIRIIKMWGVTEAKIIKEDNTTDESPPETESTENLEPYVKEHFRFVDMTHDVNKELYRLSLRHNLDKENWLASVMDTRTLSESWIKKMDADPLNAFLDVSDMIENVKLPSLPAIIMRINEAVNSPKCTATHIADIISKDTSLAARLLKIVNSSLYNFPTKINSIAHAVAIIGSRQLSLLAVGSVVTTTFKIPSEALDMESFWKHNISCGIIARILGSYKQHVNTENYFLAGLLHDIGRLIIYRNFPEQAIEIMARVSEHPDLLYTAENDTLGIDHGGLGGLLVNRWKLSPVFEHACQYHHRPLESPERMLTAIIHISDIIATAMFFGNSGDCYVPALNKEAWETINLPVSVLAPTVAQAEKLIADAVQFFTI